MNYSTFVIDQPRVIIFTNDAAITEQLQGKVDVMPARGNNTLQLDALSQRSDGAYSLQWSIENYYAYCHQGEDRQLKAYCRQVLTELPTGLKQFVKAYQGQIRPIFRAGVPVMRRDPKTGRESQLMGHSWLVNGQTGSSLQLNEGAIKVVVEPRVETGNGHTFNFTLEIQPGSTFTRWGSAVSVTASNESVEGDFLGSLLAPTVPAKATRSKKTAVEALNLPNF